MNNPGDCSVLYVFCLSNIASDRLAPPLMFRLVVFINYYTEGALYISVVNNNKGAFTQKCSNVVEML